MTDVLEILLVGLGGAQVYVGYWIGRRARKTKFEAVCPCQHHIGEHEKMTGRCRGKVRVAHYLVSGDRNGKEWVQCTCLHYAGPELISSLTMRPIAELPQATEESR